MRKKRSRNAIIERDGLLAVEKSCNILDLIWRDILQEDVGVDGTIEICLGEFPTGKIVGAQVKSGSSYINLDNSENFSFYPRKVDINYWSELSIPLFLLVYHPADKEVYWFDVSTKIYDNTKDNKESSKFIISKKNKIDEVFQAYLLGMFDLSIYSAELLNELRQDLEDVSIVLGSGKNKVKISGLDMFIEGLWGLCSKVQFHASILLSIVRRRISEKNEDSPVNYSFERRDIYPFITKYFTTLSRHHVAKLDANDINTSMYTKMELPTFIAPLTTNGRALVNHLRNSGKKNINDNQYYTLGLTPVEQIEVYDSFNFVSISKPFGRYTDVISIYFNSHLDYYRVQHFKRLRSDEKPILLISQTMYYYELTDYISRYLDNIDKNRILLRHLDLPFTPLVSWLEGWLGANSKFDIEDLKQKTNSEHLGFHDELVSIMSGFQSLEVSEPPLPGLPIKLLHNGEILDY